MRSRTRLAFSLTVASNVFIFFGWVIPFWFGRFYGNRSKTQWSIVYRIQCIQGSCETIGGILSKSIVDFQGAESKIELEAIAILATLGMAMDLLSVIIALFFHWSLCGKHFSYFYYVLGAAIVQFVAGIFVFLSIVLGGIALGDFLSVRKMDSVIEFPWSILFYAIGLILLIASSVIFFLIVINWKKYRHIYARERYYFDQSPNSVPYTVKKKPEPAFNHLNRHGEYRRMRRPYFSEMNIHGIDNPGYHGSLRYKFDPKREKYVGFLTDLRPSQRYSTMPTRGTRRVDMDRYTPYSTTDRYTHYPYYSSTDRYPTWHSQLDDVIKASHRLRMSTSDHRLRDLYL